MTLIKDYKFILRRSGVWFLLFTAAAVVLLTLSYAIPNERIAGNAEASIAMIKNEYQNDPAREWSGMFDEPANTINYGCDRKWMRRAIVDDASLNPLQAAMSVNTYTRYWHGYQIFVRPMLVIGTYEGMVSVGAALYLVLIVIVFSRMSERLGRFYALALFVALIMVRIIAVALCLNNVGCFVAALGLILFVLAFTGTEKERLLYPLFLITGMFVNYMDVLSAPLVSLGLPLTVYLVMKLSAPASASLKSNLIDTVALPLFWGVGYGLFWFLKFVIGSAVLGYNILTDAVQQAEFRILGDALHPTTPIGALTDNFAILWPNDAASRTLIVLLMAVCAAGVLLWHKPWKQVLAGTPLLIVAASPILWMCILSNHSQIHAPFVFRILSVTLFALLCFAVFCVDRSRMGKKRREGAHG